MEISESMLYWSGCYHGVRGGDGLFTPESTSHPAKMAGGLLQRVLDEGESRGWFRRGMTLLDPFYGIGTTGLARLRGYNVVGVELEQHFVDMADGCECTGVSKDDWVRYFQPDPRRRRRANYKDDRHWCPRCLTLGYEPHGPTLFTPHGTAGMIPCSESHHYTGNRELLERLAGNGIGQCTVIQGDSRDLSTFLTADVASQGQANQIASDARDGGAAYGSAVGQIGRLLDGVVTSPPYGLNSEPHRSKPADEWRNGRKWGGPNSVVRMVGYGSNNVKQIGLLAGEGYQDAMSKIYRSMYDVLAPGAVTAIVVKCPTRNWELRRLDVDTWRLLQVAGFACWCPACQEWVVGEPHDHPDVDRGIGPVCGYRAVLAREWVQLGLFSNEYRSLRGRMSFFKRYYYNLGQPTALWEDVIFARRS